MSRLTEKEHQELNKKECRELAEDIAAVTVMQINYGVTKFKSVYNHQNQGVLEELIEVLKEKV